MLNLKEKTTITNSSFKNFDKFINNKSNKKVKVNYEILENNVIKGKYSITKEENNKDDLNHFDYNSVEVNIVKYRPGIKTIILILILSLVLFYTYWVFVNRKELLQIRSNKCLNEYLENECDSQLYYTKDKEHLLSEYLTDFCGKKLLCINDDHPLFYELILDTLSIKEYIIIFLGISLSYYIIKIIK